MAHASRRLALASCAIALLLGAIGATAADGNYDTAFGNGGRLLLDLGDGDDLGTIVRRLADGRILTAGACRKETPTGSVWHWCVARLHADGRLDTSFGPDGTGRVRFDRFPLSRDIHFGEQEMPELDMLPLADGRLAFLAAATPPAPEFMRLAVLLPDGTGLDPAIGDGKGWFDFRFTPYPYNRGHKLAQQADGKLLVAGYGLTLAASGNDYSTDLAVARFAADFAGLDTGFGIGGVATVAFDRLTRGGDDVARAIAVQADGRIVLAGFAPTSSYPCGALARLLPNGLPDTSFGPEHDGRVLLCATHDYRLNAVAVDPAGRLAIAGHDYSNGGRRWSINRLNADGSQDPDFNDGAAQVFMIHPDEARLGFAKDILVQADGSLFAAGHSHRPGAAGPFWFGVAHLLADGRFDPAFGVNGRIYGTFDSAPSGGFSDVGTALAIGPEGLLIGGYAQSGPDGKLRFGLARLRLDAIFSNGFDG
jgi:uncharacterized delta-60 repeat protein